MSNMSYCRFRNTRDDIDDCIEALDCMDISSDEEKYAATDMLKNVLEFCEDKGIIDNYDRNRLIDYINECE